MFERTNQDAGRSRPTWVALIMLGLFLLSVGIAWWISFDREHLVREGVRIVAQIHKSKLESFWHGQEQSFYLIGENQRNIGWRADLRVPRQDGGFDGLLVEAIGAGGRQQLHVRTWQLNSAATQGVCQAAWLQGAEPKIYMDKGYLVEQSPKPPHISKVEIPPNFLPEGTLTLAARLVAQARGQAFFKSIYVSNSGPREAEGSQLNNIGLTNLIYKGQETLHEGGKPVLADVVEVRLGILGKERTETLYLAPEGHVLLITTPDQTFTPTTLADLVKFDPNALRTIQEEAEDFDFHPNVFKPLLPSPKETPPEDPF